ncbi:MAG: pyruvate, phosphate dikinase [Gemmatimonadetes bacterium]|nr:pyruvate, phosphate dikinase [Gemmatimonadota bacterium]MYB58421.1 pyruvate, phosphate dikinase [Gemmatimonadota bacterium]
MATAKQEEKYVYFFGDGKAEGSAEMRNLLGGKGANLAEMSGLGIPVPAGFTITTEVCTYYYDNDKQYPDALEKQVLDNVAKLENVMGGKFGDATNPLLLSVRSGARVSMPGMMETVLNLGLNDEITEGLIARSNNPRFGWDSYRRFIQTYGDVVMGVAPEGLEIDPFEAAIEEVKEKRGIEDDLDMTVEDLKILVDMFKDIVQTRTGQNFPTDPIEQLWGGIGAVFGSWQADRAITYRRLENIPGDWGTAVNVQSMVYGNMGDDCATGVAFTRDPSTGENTFYGEFLTNAQGEDVVAGVRTPEPVERLKSRQPEAYQTLEGIYQTLEKHYRDMQDIEFTVQQSKLWMLQTRGGKRTAAAAVKIAVDMVNEGLITRSEAIQRVEPEQLDQLLHPTFDPSVERSVLATGLPASPGAASGKVVFLAEEAEEAAEQGERVLLVRLETSPEDIGGMNAAQGILTARGGMTSHAAVVARGMGKCCVAGCGDLAIDYTANQFSVGDTVVKGGDWVSIDGSTGEVMLGQVPTQESEITSHFLGIAEKSQPEQASTQERGLLGDFITLMGWIDKIRTLDVRTNSDTPHDSAVARAFGAQGIGLCRTEHMFFEGDRINIVREMILADDEQGRRRALEKLLPIQRGDFEGIFNAMAGLPVTVRLLDPPLHEFLPHESDQQEEMARRLDTSLRVIQDKVESLNEFNPMLGHRGCRLGITYPEIYEMQVRAILEAAANVGSKAVPEIMIPLVGAVKEFTELKIMTDRVGRAVESETGKRVAYLIGTMIEIPRAALTAAEIAEHAEFFSFGTNDLTQMTYGYSRDDAGKFLGEYVEKGILENDPFQTLDQTGVGQLVELGTKNGRGARSDLKVGICGEHGGDPSSVHFCHNIGMDYVSCSPFRVPIARLAAAHAALED